MKNWVKSLLRRTPFTIVNRTQRRGINLLDDVRDLLRSSQSSVFFDVGANEGQTALEFRRQFPQTQIHSFEPGREAFSRLEANTGKLPQVHCHHLAVGSKPGVASLHLHESTQRNSLLPELPGVPAGTEEVSVTTIEAFCAVNGIVKIDLLKTDTEGFDLEVIAGAGALLREGHISLIYSEVGVRNSDRRHTSLRALLNFLEPQGYHLFALYDQPPRRAEAEREHFNGLFVLDSAIVL